MDSAQLSIQFCDKEASIQYETVHGQRKWFLCCFPDLRLRNHQRSFEQKTDTAPPALVCLFICCGDLRLTDLLLPPVFSGSIYSAEDANKRSASYLTAPL